MKNNCYINEYQKTDFHISKSTHSTLLTAKPSLLAENSSICMGFTFQHKTQLLNSRLTQVLRI